MTLFTVGSSQFISLHGRLWLAEFNGLVIPNVWGCVVVNWVGNMGSEAECIWESSEAIENPSWAPIRNRVHPLEFVFEKSWVIVSHFCGIQTHEGELYSVWAPMIDCIS